MRIRMLRSALGSPDGSNVYGYEAGHNYLASDPHQETGAYAASPLPLSNRLAALFVAEGWAEDTDAASVSGEAASPSDVAAPVASSPVEAAPVSEPAPVAEKPSPETPEPEAASASVAAENATESTPAAKAAKE